MRNKNVMGFFDQPVFASFRRSRCDVYFADVGHNGK